MEHRQSDIDNLYRKGFNAYVSWHTAVAVASYLPKDITLESRDRENKNGYFEVCVSRQLTSRIL